MDQNTLRPIMVTLAVATPAVGICMLLVGQSIARSAGEAMSPSLRRSGWILIAAGPLNLMLWFLFNEWLNAIGYRSAVGYLAAAAVFFAMGWGSGFFSRLLGRAGSRKPDRDPGGGDPPGDDGALPPRPISPDS